MPERKRDNEKQELARLRRALAESQAKHTKPAVQGAPSNALGLAMRVITDLIGAIVVGTAMGYGLDFLTGLAPLFLILFFFLGLAAGIFNVMKTAKEMNRSGDEIAPNDENDKLG